jgi:SAM-dependent methyltransferase
VSGPASERREDLARFYAEGYDAAGADARRLGAWRALGARAKADHVMALCAEAGLRPASVVEVGCGDGALLAELRARGFAPGLWGYELSPTAVEIARGRGLAVEAFDGEHLPEPDGRFELGILSHVLEHVPDPAALLAETARVAGAVVVEVPLEANLSAGRAAKRGGAAEIGHLHRLSRGAVRAIVERAGLAVAAELSDPLTREAHAFFAATAAQRGRAAVKSAVRRGVHAVSPPAAERLFTVHYACLARRPGRVP